MRLDRKTALTGVLVALALASTPVIAQSISVDGGGASVSVGGNDGGGASVSVGSSGSGSAGSSGVGVNLGGTGSGSGGLVGGNVLNGGSSNSSTATVNVGSPGKSSVATVDLNGDGVINSEDNKLLVLDTNGDGILNISDDVNGDGILSGLDLTGEDAATPLAVNLGGGSDSVVSVDGSGDGTTATVDLNGDGIINGDDNKLLVLDTNGDGILNIGDDVNGDGILSGLDLSGENAATPLAVIIGGDSDSVVNVDGSGDGTTATVDLNGDGIVNGDDNKLLALDTDGNGVLNVGDDVNGDGILSGLDLGNANATPLTVDLNGDSDSVVNVDRSGNGTAATIDLNGDGVINGEDNQLLALDTDGNGILDVGDDVNGDGILNGVDVGGNSLARGLSFNLDDPNGDTSGAGAGTDDAGGGVTLGGVGGSKATGATIGGFAADQPIAESLTGEDTPPITVGGSAVKDGSGSKSPGTVGFGAVGNDDDGSTGSILGETTGSLVDAGNLPIVGDTGSVLASADPTSQPAQTAPEDGQIGTLAQLTPRQLSDTLDSLSSQDVSKLKTRCGRVLAAGAHFTRSTIAVCRVIASL